MVWVIGHRGLGVHYSDAGESLAENHAESIIYALMATGVSGVELDVAYAAKIRNWLCSYLNKLQQEEKLTDEQIIIFKDMVDKLKRDSDIKDIVIPEYSVKSLSPYCLTDGMLSQRTFNHAMQLLNSPQSLVLSHTHGDPNLSSPVATLLLRQAPAAYTKAQRALAARGNSAPLGTKHLQLELKAADDHNTDAVDVFWETLLELSSIRPREGEAEAAPDPLDNLVVTILFTGSADTNPQHQGAGTIVPPQCRGSVLCRKALDLIIDEPEAKKGSDIRRIVVAWLKKTGQCPEHPSVTDEPLIDGTTQRFLDFIRERAASIRIMGSVNSSELCGDDRVISGQGQLFAVKPGTTCLESGIKPLEYMISQGLDVDVPFFDLDETACERIAAAADAVVKTRGAQPILSLSATHCDFKGQYAPSMFSPSIGLLTGMARAITIEEKTGCRVCLKTDNPALTAQALNFVAQLREIMQRPQTNARDHEIEELRNALFNFVSEKDRELGTNNGDVIVALMSEFDALKTDWAHKEIAEIKLFSEPLRWGRGRSVDERGYCLDELKCQRGLVAEHVGVGMLGTLGGEGQRNYSTAPPGQTHKGNTPGGRR